MKIKLLVLLLSISSLMIWESCKGLTESPDTFFPTRRVIENDSGVPVNVIIYESGRDTQEGFELMPGEARIDEEVCVKSLASLTCDLILDRRRDSVVLEFNGEKKIRYCSFEQSCYEGFDSKNIMLLSLSLENDEHNTGYIKTVEGDTSVYTFTITEEDFASADPI